MRQTPFRGRIHLVLALLGIIPYLLTIYIFMQSDLGLSEGISLIAAMVLIFHFAGYHILRAFSDELGDLVRVSAVHKRPGGSYPALPVPEEGTAEVVQLRHNFNDLLEELKASREKFDTVTIELLRESRKSFVEYERRLAELSPYVDPTIVHRIVNSRDASVSGLRGEHRRVAILFLDICSFTKTAEALPPEAIVTMLNDFFDVAVQIIHRHNGVVDKFIGDAVMAIFGLTSPLYQVSVDAVDAALDLQTATHRLMKQWHREGRKTFRVRVGINTGEVVAGNIGSRDRMDYTVVGDAVNVAARIVDHAQADEVWISSATYRSCKSFFLCSSCGSIRVKNRNAEVECYVVKSRLHRAFEQYDTQVTRASIEASKR